MKNISAKIACFGLILAGFAVGGWATEPLPLAVRMPLPRTGKVLVLENERTLTGDIEQVDERFRVRRRVGETWVPASEVVALCGSMEEAYQYLRGRANLHDPDERMRLANWCRLNDLREQALAEVEAAAQLRPDDVQVKRLLRYLQDTKNRPTLPA